MGREEGKRRRETELEKAVVNFTALTSSRGREKPRHTLTKAEMGQVAAPQFRIGNAPQDHMKNAYVEFVAITVATKKVSIDVCTAILQTYRRRTQGLLQVLLGEAEAAIYDNSSQRVLQGTMSGEYMAACCESSGFVERSEEEEKGGQPKFRAPGRQSLGDGKNHL
jgi:hypothetical protein